MSEAFLLDGLDIHDGDVTVITGFSLGEPFEREVVLPLRITTDTRAQAVALVDRIAAIVSQERYELHYTTDGGSTSVFALRKGQLRQKWDVQAENQAVIDVDLTLPAEDDLVRSPTRVTTTPSSYTPVVLDSFDAATSNWSAPSGTLVSVGGGQQVEGTGALQWAGGLPVSTLTRTGLGPFTFDNDLNTVNIRMFRAAGLANVDVALTLRSPLGSLVFPAQRVTAGAGWQDIVFSNGVEVDDFSNNMMSLNQASIETDATGWTAPANCSLARVTTEHYHGVAALRMTATASLALMNAQVSTFLPCTAGTTMRAVGRFKAGTIGRSVQMLINFYTAAGAFVSQVVGSVVTDSTSGWTYAYAEGVVPATATKAYVYPQVLAAAAGEVHYVDALGFFDPGPVKASLVTDYTLTATSLNGVSQTDVITLDDGRILQDGAGSAGLFSFSRLQGSARTEVALEIAQATAIAYAVVARYPSRPPAFSPALTYNNTNATLTLPCYAYTGEFAVIAEIDAPSTAPTVTVTAAQTGGTSKVISATGVASARFVEVGHLTLPPLGTDPSNLVTTFTLQVVSTLSVKRLFLFPLEGEALIIGNIIPGVSAGMTVVAPKRIFIDPSDAVTNVPRVSGSPVGTDRSDAKSLVPWLLGNLTPSFEPGQPNQLYVITDGTPTVQASYYPKWFGARP